MQGGASTMNELSATMNNGGRGEVGGALAFSHFSSNQLTLLLPRGRTCSLQQFTTKNTYLQLLYE
jgi:hypothetical protein